MNRAGTEGRTEKSRPRWYEHRERQGRGEMQIDCY